jgi:hypothetical protein
MRGQRVWGVCRALACVVGVLALGCLPCESAAEAGGTTVEPRTYAIRAPRPPRGAPASPRLEGPGRDLVSESFLYSQNLMKEAWKDLEDDSPGWEFGGTAKFRDIGRDSIFGSMHDLKRKYDFKVYASSAGKAPAASAVVRFDRHRLAPRHIAREIYPIRDMPPDPYEKPMRIDTVLVSIDSSRVTISVDVERLRAGLWLPVEGRWATSLDEAVLHTMCASLFWLDWAQAGRPLPRKIDRRNEEEQWKFASRAIKELGIKLPLEP